MLSIHCFGRLFPSRLFLSAQVVAVLISTFGLLITGTVFAASWETSSLRAPGGGLIRIGMTRQEVLKELGQSGHTQNHGTASEKPAKQRNALTYRGDDGLYTITFSGDRVSQIVVSPKRD